LVLLIALVLVFLISFGMGRLSVLSGDEELKIESCNTEEKNQKIGSEAGNEIYQFVGSRNSNKYHPLSGDCAWREKIKAENKIFFKNKQDAENKGYSSSSCVRP